MKHEARTSSDDAVLTFKIAEECFGLAADEVAEIIRPREITRVPLAHVNLLGVVNHRGTVLPVISLARLLGHDTIEQQQTSRVVVVDKGALLGLLVDEVFALTQESDAKRIDLDALLLQDFGRLRHVAASHTNRRRQVADLDKTGTSETKHETLALVAFPVAGQEYALPLESVVEVMALTADIAVVPHTDQVMAGVTAFHGGLLPLVSLRALLGLSTDDFDPRRARVIVTRVGASRVGLLADGANAILRVGDEVIDPVPSVLTRGAGEAQIDAICRLDGGRRLVSILSPTNLFDRATASRFLADAELGATQMPASTGHGEQFVVFALGDEQYGLPIAAVDEVVRRPDTLTRVPRAPAFVEGVMNLRGKVVPVIDQRLRFASAGVGGRRRRVVIITIDGLQAGFAVDSISEIISAMPQELTTAPELSADGVQVFDRVVRLERDRRMILLVDPKALLDRAERDLLVAIADATQPAAAS
jgi:purine-binding chemotaxis protein CheW